MSDSVTSVREQAGSENISGAIYLLEVRNTAARTTASSYSSEFDLIASINADRGAWQVENLTQALEVLNQTAMITLVMNANQARAWAELHAAHHVETYRVAAARLFAELAANKLART